MNLLNEISTNNKNIKIFEDEDEDEFTISSFRKNQYKLIEDFMKLIVDYISSQSKNSLVIDTISIIDMPDYCSIYESHFISISVYLKNVKPPSIFLKLIIPKLVSDCFFILNGNYFVPTLYMIDKPIVLKKKSLKFTGLFNSISVFEKLVTFIGKGMPVNHFVSMFINDNDDQLKFVQENINENIQSFTPIPEKELYSFFQNIFYCKNNKETIIEFAEKLFFDPYTKLLYEKCYNMKQDEINLNNILMLSLKIKNNVYKYRFIDLNHKLLIFLEALLSPLLKKVGIIAVNAARGASINMIQMQQMAIVKYFNVDLTNKFIYDNVNAFSGMLIHKVDMLNPGSKTSPSVIAELHPTHFKRICPISVSSQNPGETLYIVPGTKIDFLGQFIDL